MADIQIIGAAPKSSEGKEFYLHSTDWWWEIIEVFKKLLKDDYEKYFIRESFLAMPTPSMDDEESFKFSVLVDNIMKDGTVSTCLRKIYKEEECLVDYYGDDEKLIDDGINHRIEQIKEFTKFLKSCGGCSVNWNLS